MRQFAFNLAARPAFASPYSWLRRVSPRAFSTDAIDKVNLVNAFSAFSDHWSPKIVGQINNFHIKLVKVLYSLLYPCLRLTLIAAF
jgi:hypothetical protein